MPNIEILIIKYQTLIGSFSAVIFSIVLFLLKERYEDFKKKREYRKGISKTFLQMARVGIESTNDLKHNLNRRKTLFKKNDGKFHVCLSNKTTRIPINYDLLNNYKHSLPYWLGEQIDIAINSAEQFNSHLLQIEEIEKYLYEDALRNIEIGLKSKGVALDEYIENQNIEIARIEKMFDEHFHVNKRLLLRPIVSEQNWKNMHYQVLDLECERMLADFEMSLG